jgi:hypothetical protein
MSHARALEFRLLFVKHRETQLMVALMEKPTLTGGCVTSLNK